MAQILTACLSRSQTDWVHAENFFESAASVAVTRRRISAGGETNNLLVKSSARPRTRLSRAAMDLDGERRLSLTSGDSLRYGVKEGE